jgi:hypothetical protein
VTAVQASIDDYSSLPAVPNKIGGSVLPKTVDMAVQPSASPALTVWALKNLYGSDKSIVLLDTIENDIKRNVTVSLDITLRIYILSNIVLYRLLSI